MPDKSNFSGSVWMHRRSPLTFKGLMWHNVQHYTQNEKNAESNAMAMRFSE